MSDEILVAHLLETVENSLWSRLDSMIYSPVEDTASRMQAGTYVDGGFQIRHPRLRGLQAPKIEGSEPVEVLF